MNRFIVLLMFLSVTAAELNNRQRRFLVSKCSAEEDCGPNKCCLFGKVCSPRLPKYSTCFLTDLHRCGCADGLACRVTKTFSMLGQKVEIRQCMPVEDKISVETIEEEEMTDLAGDRQKRFLFNSCNSGTDCGENKCCIFGKICAPKLPKDATCYLRSAHKCGCGNGLECRTTTHITIPFIHARVPLRQCVEPL